MTDEVWVFAAFTLAGSALLAAQMLNYSRRIGRLRQAVAVLTDEAEQHAAGRSRG